MGTIYGRNVCGIWRNRRCSSIILRNVVLVQGFVERLVNNKLEDLENEIQQNREITIKLIDRWNKETTKADRRHESVIENAERRHEKLTFELRTQSEVLNF